ncbi:MAG: APC family permease [Acidobacteriaceae bacterium]
MAGRPVQEVACTQRLKAGAIGPWGLAALVIGVTSPAVGLYATWGPIEAATGPVAPLVFLAALVITFPTVVSYACLNRHAPSAAAVATWLWTAIDPMTGILAGLVMMTYFLMIAISAPLLFGLFFRDLMVSLHWAIPGMAAIAAGLILHSVLIAWICLRGAEASAKTTIRLMIIETGVVLALSITILCVKGAQPGAINLGPFNPAHATQGAAGFWKAVILGLMAFSGFDVIATVAEEAQAPRENVPRVLILAVIGIALFWVANAWAFTLSMPAAEIDAYNAAGLTAVTPVARAYWGWGNLIVIATAFTGLTAIYIAGVQGASRTIFALARHRLLPAPFAKLEGDRRVPRRAVLFVVFLCILLGLASLAILRNGLDSFIWWTDALVFFATLTFIAVNVANIFYFLRIERAHFSVIRNLLVPIAGVLLNLYLIYAAFFSSLWPTPIRTGKSIVIVCLALFALQLLAVAAARLYRRELLSGSAPTTA